MRFTGETASVDTGSVSGDALYLSGETFLCANDVVVVTEGDLDAVAVAAQLAAAVEGPLLFPDPRLAAELGRLKPLRVHTVGNPEVNPPGNATLIQHDIAGAVAATSERLATEQTLTSTGDEETVVESVLAIRDRDRVLEPANSTCFHHHHDSGVARYQARGRRFGATVGERDDLAGLGRRPDKGATRLRGGTECRRLRACVRRLRHPGEHGACGGPGRQTFRLDTILGEGARDERMGTQPPPQWGGASRWRVLHPSADRQRRYVSFYGHPETTALGALGEQSPAATIDRMSGFLNDYAADGAQVIPAFELIVSVAAAGATMTVTTASSGP